MLFNTLHFWLFFAVVSSGSREIVALAAQGRTRGEPLNLAGLDVTTLDVGAFIAWARIVWVLAAAVLLAAAARSGRPRLLLGLAVLGNAWAWGVTTGRCSGSTPSAPAPTASNNMACSRWWRPEFATATRRSHSISSRSGGW